MRGKTYLLSVSDYLKSDCGFETAGKNQNRDDYCRYDEYFHCVLLLKVVCFYVCNIPDSLELTNVFNQFLDPLGKPIVYRHISV